MFRWLCMFAVALLVVAPVQAGGITGQYVEARTTEVFAGPCFANADTSLTGKHAVLCWKVDQGTLEGVQLDGLAVVAVIAARDTLGLQQSAPGKAVLIVDKRASTAQREALIRLARRQGGALIDNVVAVESAPIELLVGNCAEGGCCRLVAGAARIETRCIHDKHDKTCGNEMVMYPPLARDVKAKAVFSLEHAYTGKAINETWKDGERRGAYLGTFEIR